STAVGWLLIVVTVLSLGSVAAAYVGPRRANPVVAGRLRVSFNVAYLLVVLAFVVFNAVQTVRYGGSIRVPGGLGPGGWLGVAGALLCAQPVISHVAADEGRFAGWLVG